MKTEAEIKKRFEDMLNLRFNQLECGPGWGDIIWEALEKVEASEAYKSLKEDEWKIPIIKEKFGSLRIQTSSGTDEIWDIFDKAEEKSMVTCEGCGAPAELNDKGWCYCLCDTCKKERRPNS